MKKKCCFAELKLDVFERVVMRGLIYIGRRKYFSPSLIPLSGQKVEIVRSRGDLELVHVFFDGEPVCLAALYDGEVNAFPARPFVKGRMERQIRMTGRSYNRLCRAGGSNESDAIVRSMLMNIRDGLDAVINFMDNKPQSGEF